MNEELNNDVVYVCPERDIECGAFERNWCEQCPKRRATPPSPSTFPTTCTHGGMCGLGGYCDACPYTSPSTASEVVELDERYEFERYMSQLGEAVNYMGDGIYASGFVQDRWDTWMARAALAAKPAAREVEFLPPLQRLTVEEITIAAVKALTTVVHPGCTPKESHLLNSGFLNGVKFAAEHASRSGLLKDAANEAQPSSGEVDVEAERKLFEAWYAQDDDGLRSIERMGDHYKLLQAQLSWTAWLAARTQVPAQTGSGEEGNDAG